jgi:hypothetical protein
MQRALWTCWFAGVACVLVWSLVSAPASAQPGIEEVRRTAGEPTNLFATLDPSRPVDGFVLDVPGGWAVQDVLVLRYGSEAVPVRVQPGPSGAVVVPEAPLRGPHEVVVQVALPGSEGSYRWHLDPFERPADGRRTFTGGGTEQRVVLAPPLPTDDAHRALSLDPEAASPVVLRAEMLPPMERSVSFTVEAWIATTGLGEVVLSTWTGDEQRAYPLDLVVAPDGRLRSYCGQPGRHTSLVTERPVADGRWHHVAVAYDASRRLLRLIHDGTAVDSVQNVSLPGGYLQPDVAVGGRLSEGRRSEGRLPGGSSFSGRIDELRFWAVARTAREVRRTMRDGIDGRPAAARRTPRSNRTDGQGPRPVVFSFDERPDAGVLAGAWPRTAQLVPSSLRMDRAVRNLHAKTTGGEVHLQWESVVPSVEAFVVERSTDGRRFETVARLTRTDAKSGAAAERRYQATDAPDAQVAYYRIREVYAGDVERVSGTLKVGLGSEADARSTELIGNYPNPFSTTTTIEYYLAESEPVTIGIWDVAGKRVVTLVDEVQPAGRHELPFDAANLPSGSYFVRLQTPSYSGSHRLVVLK